MFGPYHKDFNGRKIKSANIKDIEPQEVFLDSLAQRKKDKDGLSSGKIEVPLSRRCFYGLFVFSIFIFSILLFRSFQLQVIRSQEFFEKAQRNRFTYSFIQSSRGVIYDKNFNQLVYNKSIFNLVAVKKDLPPQQKELIFKKIAQIINVNYQELIEKYNQSESDEFVIMEDLNHKDLISLEIKTRDLAGIEIERQTSRYYQDSEVFSHLIGYLGKISPEETQQLTGFYSIDTWTGKSGLERSYEDVLKIIPGQNRIERDVKGTSIAKEIVTAPQSGNSLVLTIDADFQREVYSILEKNLKNIGSKNAAVIAMNPRTGEVLTLVSFPGFNNNAFSTRDADEINNLFNDPLRPLFNRVISGSYPVGSTIKPFMGIAALQEKLVTPEKQFYSAGHITIPNPWNPSSPAIYRDLQAHGWVDLRRAIAVSSNVYFYIIGGGYENQKGLGGVSIKNYLNLFGWGTKTGIDLPNEIDGFIPDPQWKKETKKEPWTVGDTYNLSIGQSDISVTPLQVTYAYNAIANNGKLMKPMIVSKIIDDKRNVVEEKKPQIVKEDFVSLNNIRVVREGMRDAVLYGSASMLQSLPVSSAAKTGTAQISKPGHYHNWVSVFAPYDNPEIVLTVVIEEVQGIRAAALPVARDILYWYFTNN